MKKCYIVGAGPKALHPFDRHEDDLLIAADGGYDALAARGIVPDLVVGDFDSRSGVPDHPHIIRLAREKDDTDMMAAIRLGLNRGYRAFHLYNAMGGRTDHTLANIQSLAFLTSHGARGFLYDEDQVLFLIENETAALPAGAGTVSVFAFGAAARGVEIQGLYYPVNGLDFTPDYPLGVSNERTGQPAKISVHQGRLLICCPLDCPVSFEQTDAH